MIIVGGWFLSIKPPTTVVPLVLAGQSGMPNLVITSVPGCARPLPVPPRDWDSEEGVRLSCAVRLSLLKGSWPAPALAFGLVFLDLLGLSRWAFVS